MTESDPKPNHPALDVARTAVGVVILAATAIIVVLSYVVPRLRICRDALAQDGTVHQLCGPVGPEDLPSLGILAIAVFVLIPSLAEISFGSVGLKRRVKELESQVAQLSQQQTVNSFQTVVVDPGRVLAQLDEKLASTQATAPPIDTPRATEFGKRYLSDERARAESALLRAWNHLDAIVNRVDGRRDASGVPMISLPASPTERDWRAKFRDELATVQAARNAIAHRPGTVSDEQVKEAVELAERLLAILNDVESGRRQ